MGNYSSEICGRRSSTVRSFPCSRKSDGNPREWSFGVRRLDHNPATGFEAHLRWIGERLARSHYRGCPQINVAAEFAEADHPARQVAREHMRLLRMRWRGLALRLGAARPNELAAQLALLVNGAFASAGLLTPGEAPRVLLASGRALIASSR